MLDKDEVVRRIHDLGAVGIVRVDSPENCMKIMEAWVEGGLNAIEVTTTTPDAVATIRKAADKFGGSVTIGIGTVLDRGTAEKGVAAGAQFVVSPSLHKEVVDVCRELRVASCPGTFTATEIVQASSWGADLIKVFPASQVGPGYIRALLAPLPWVRLVPTGGVDAKNAPDFIRAGAFCVGVGNALIPDGAVAGGRYDLLTSAAKNLLEAIKGARAESV